jgi:hypothetical protein
VWLRNRPISHRQFCLLGGVCVGGGGLHTSKGICISMKITSITFSEVPSILMASLPLSALTTSHPMAWSRFSITIECAQLSSTSNATVPSTRTLAGSTLGRSGSRSLLWITMPIVFESVFSGGPKVTSESGDGRPHGTVNQKVVPRSITESQPISPARRETN